MVYTEYTLLFRILFERHPLLAVTFHLRGMVELCNKTCGCYESYVRQVLWGYTAGLLKGFVSA